MNRRERSLQAGVLLDLSGGVFVVEESLIEGVDAGIHAAFQGVDAGVEAMLHGAHANIQAPEKTEQCNAGSNDGKVDLSSVTHADSLTYAAPGPTAQPTTWPFCRVASSQRHSVYQRRHWALIAVARQAGSNPDSHFTIAEQRFRPVDGETGHPCCQNIVHDASQDAPIYFAAGPPAQNL